MVSWMGKAKRTASGDKPPMWLLARGSNVAGRTVPPSLLASYHAHPSFRQPLNHTNSPSGLHDGIHSLSNDVSASRISPPPAMLAVLRMTRCMSHNRPATYATSFPSGEIAGWNSTPGSVVTCVMSEMVMLRGPGLTTWLTTRTTTAMAAPPAAQGAQRGTRPGAVVSRAAIGVVSPLGVARGPRSARTTSTVCGRSVGAPDGKRGTPSRGAGSSPLRTRSILATTSRSGSKSSSARRRRA